MGSDEVERCYSSAYLLQWHFKLKTFYDKRDVVLGEKMQQSFKKA